MKLTAAIAQQQVLSSQMKQGLELLEAPIMELEHMIATEMLANPLLEGEAPLESNISEKNETTFLQDDPAWMESTNDQQAQEKHFKISNFIKIWTHGGLKSYLKAF